MKVSDFIKIFQIFNIVSMINFHKLELESSIRFVNGFIDIFAILHHYDVSKYARALQLSEIVTFEPQVAQTFNLVSFLNEKTFVSKSSKSQ